MLLYFVFATYFQCLHVVLHATVSEPVVRSSILGKEGGKPLIKGSEAAYG